MANPNPNPATQFTSDRAKEAGGTSYYKKRYHELQQAHEELQVKYEQDVAKLKMKLAESELKLAKKTLEMTPEQRVLSSTKVDPLQLTINRYNELLELDEDELSGNPQYRKELSQLTETLIAYIPKAKQTQSVTEDAVSEDDSDDSIDAILAKFK
ncbi:hypothetical protein [Endozoicomonas sp. ALB032]|uniref:hypothetical protein n=1 Tax=Endozoicomonas sp. ALB032 TaxID=3403082 RepID=UPI003BB7B3A6